MKNYDLIIIGAGIAGMTAATSAINKGIKSILLIDKDECVGGLINQCIHNGFGKNLLGIEVTGPEYVSYIEESIDKNRVEILLQTNVLEVTRDKIVTYVNPKQGQVDVKGIAIIFAMGAKERFFEDAMLITKKLIGIYTVGEAQRIINFEGYLPGKKNVIVAKNKWGFILARRLLVEGGEVEAVVIKGNFEEIVTEEIQNIITGFDISIIDCARVEEISGEERIENVKIKNLRDESTIDVECDALILTVKFEPDDSLIRKMKFSLSAQNNMKEASEYKILKDGFFACGNIIYGEDAFNREDINGILCGEQAAKYIMEESIRKL